MYSDEEKVHYLEMMWAEGLTPGGAEKKWGRPSRGVLSKWLKEAEEGKLDVQRPQLPGACQHIKWQRYPAETKAEAIRRTLAGEKPANIARSLGIQNGDIITDWVHKLLKSYNMGSWSAVAAPKEKGPDPMPTQDEKDQKIKELEEENDWLAEQLEHEHMLFRSVLEVMRDPKAEGLPKHSMRAFVGCAEKLRKDCGISLKTILSITNISKSTYEYNRKKLTQTNPEKDLEALDKAVAAAFEKSHGTYGYRRIYALLRQEGMNVSYLRIRGSMHRQNLFPHCAKKHPGYRSYKGEVSDANPLNLLVNKYGGHDFGAEAPNQKWLTDVSEIKAADGRLYLSVIIDCFDGRCISWAISEHPNSELVLTSLESALVGLRAGEEPLLHSDRGMLYQRSSWSDACKGKVQRSMSRKGHPQDNASCESFFGFLKCEFYYPLQNKRLNRKELKEQIDSYIRWYNESRLRAFKEPDGTTHYETIDGRRRRLGLTV